MKCVLIEIDNHGFYERFALTPEEFEERYRKIRPDIPEESEDSCSYTLRPLVHMWYMLVEVGCKEWNYFFSDMTWGLPWSDIDEGNYAYVAEDNFGELKNAWRELCCASLRTI